MKVDYKYGGKLVGKKMRRPLKITVTVLQFADDADLVCSSGEGVERSARTLDQVASQWGLTLSLQKTKLMVLAHGVKRTYSLLSSEEIPAGCV